MGLLRVLIVWRLVRLAAPLGDGFCWSSRLQYRRGPAARGGRISNHDSRTFIERQLPRAPGPPSCPKRRGPQPSPTVQASAVSQGPQAATRRARRNRRL